MSNPEIDYCVDCSNPFYTDSLIYPDKKLCNLCQRIESIKKGQRTCEGCPNILTERDTEDEQRYYCDQCECRLEAI